MIDELNVDWTSLTKADMYTIIKQTEEQNAKLRELVRDLYECGDSCTHCRHWNQGDEFYCGLGVGWKARRMRELGVEVKLNGMEAQVQPQLAEEEAGVSDCQ